MEITINKVGIVFVFLFSFIILVSCGGNSRNEKDLTQVETVPESTEDERHFQLPSIPVTIITPEERTDYVTRNYWENFDFSDTLWLASPDVLEQAMSNYLGLLLYSPITTVSHSIENLLKGASVNDEMFGYFQTLLEKYLYDPNSPMRNEEHYIQVLNYIVNSDSVDQLQKDRAKYRLGLLLKNRVGEKATDITYTLASGKTGTLYNIKAPYTILMFYNPDCHTCEETITYLKSSSVINELLRNNRLSILAYYPDEDLSIWEKHLSDIPGNWINGYDKGQQVEKKKIYDLRAIPTLYLLNENKHVILKDAPVEQIENYLWEVHRQ